MLLEGEFRLLPLEWDLVSELLARISHHRGKTDTVESRNHLNSELLGNVGNAAASVPYKKFDTFFHLLSPLERGTQ